MELLKYLRVIKKRLWIIIAITVIAIMLSTFLSIFVISPIYEAKTALIIGRISGAENSTMGYDDIMLYMRLVKTYAELAKSPLVIDEAISTLKYELTYEDIEKKFKVIPKADTQIFEIVIQDKDPAVAVQLANTLSYTLLQKAKIVLNTDAVKIMDEAKIPKKPSKPDILLNIIEAFIIGLISSTGIIFLIEYFDNTIKSEDDVGQHLGIAVLASIPDIIDS